MVCVLSIQSKRFRNCLNTSPSSRALLMREVELQKRRKAAVDLLQWHRKLMEEEKRVADLELVANSIINEVSKPSGNEVGRKTQNVTKWEEGNSNDRVASSLSQLSLERLYRDAKKHGGKHVADKNGKYSDKDSSYDSINTDVEYSSDVSSVIKTNALSVRDTEEKSQNSEITTRKEATNNYSSDFETPTSLNNRDISNKSAVAEKHKNSDKISSITDLIDNLTKISEESPTLSKRSSLNKSIDSEIDNLGSARKDATKNCHSEIHSISNTIAKELRDDTNSLQNLRENLDNSKMILEEIESLKSCIQKITSDASHNRNLERNRRNSSRSQTDLNCTIGEVSELSSKNLPTDEKLSPKGDQSGEWKTESGEEIDSSEDKFSAPSEVTSTVEVVEENVTEEDAKTAEEHTATVAVEEEDDVTDSIEKTVSGSQDAVTATEEDDHAMEEEVTEERNSEEISDKPLSASAPFIDVSEAEDFLILNEESISEKGDSVNEDNITDNTSKNAEPTLSVTENEAIYKAPSTTDKEEPVATMNEVLKEVSEEIEQSVEEKTVEDEEKVTSASVLYQPQYEDISDVSDLNVTENVDPAVDLSYGIVLPATVDQDLSVEDVVTPVSVPEDTSLKSVVSIPELTIDENSLPQVVTPPKDISETDEAATKNKVPVDVKKRVSEILADAHNSSRGDKSPRLQDFYVTTYDVISPESSPELRKFLNLCLL